MSLKARLRKLEPKGPSKVLFRKTVYEKRDGSEEEVFLRALIIGPNVSLRAEATESEADFRERVEQVAKTGTSS